MVKHRYKMNYINNRFTVTDKKTGLTYPYSYQRQSEAYDLIVRMKALDKENNDEWEVLREDT